VKIAISGSQYVTKNYETGFTKKCKMYSMSSVTRYMMKNKQHHSQNWTALV